MSSQTVNPYQSPAVKMSDGDAADPKYRDIAVFVLLNVVTLGIYWFYLAYQWAKEVNGLVGRPKYQPAVVLLVSIVTCGIAGLVFEALYAFDIAEQLRGRNMPGRIDQLAMWVIVINCVALAVSLIPLGFLIGLPLGILASVMVQIELNKLAEGYATTVK